MNGSAATDVEGTVGDATVTVRVGEADAVARAQAPPPAGDGTEGLTPAMAAAVARAGALLGSAGPDQLGLAQPGPAGRPLGEPPPNPYPVARPGTSMHERGLAIDVPRSFVATLRTVAAAVGPVPTPARQRPRTLRTVPADTGPDGGDVTTLQDDDDLTDDARGRCRSNTTPTTRWSTSPTPRSWGTPPRRTATEDVDLLTDGPYGPDEGPDAAADGLVVPPVTKQPSRREHRAEMKASARRVRRVVRHIDTWSVFKVATIFVACIWGVVVLASLLVWRAAVTSGSVENTEDFIIDLGFEDFNFNPEQMFEALLSAGAVIAIAAIFFIWLLTVLFNLICDITGGLRITMIEQDLADARKRRKKKAATTA